MRGAIDIQDDFDVPLVTFAGTTPSLQPLPYVDVVITGAVTMTADVVIANDLTIRDNSGLTLAGFDLDVGGDLFANGPRA